ncbi:ribonuclease inhibitor [Chryseobacterium arthrosphaerae]|uniref:ribonuclease inhibitor n=1 Tax=Chryseobacterium arthrosphaerae TaxID=651561 RepID=UPI001F4B54D3|nr:ribonuclease inhibitor [Chryseobacterium arthrosphaerae]MDG4654329.1 ribonuclease inhibitor [Chryseobacterium arthrosphaerae]
MLNTSNNNTEKMIVIHGGHFSSLEGFYEEASNVLMKNTDWKIGTLDGFDDILYGGFGVFENNEPIEIVWRESQKSAEDLGIKATREFYGNKIRQGKPFNTKLLQQKLDDLMEGKGQTLFEILVEIIQSHANIQLVLA